MAQPAIPSLPSPESTGRDPLAAVLRLGGDAARVGAVLGLLGALLLHGAAGVQAAANLYEAENFAVRVAEYGDTTNVLKLPLAPVAYLMGTMIIVAALIHVSLIFVPWKWAGRKALP